MAENVQSIKSLEELKRAQAAAQQQGTQVTNYAEWAQILQNLEEAGVESTGSYSGDKEKLNEVEKTIQNYIEQRQEEAKTQQNKSETKHVENISKSDNEQSIKANMANSVSSTIMADYMKYYHLLA